ncbi:16028_t:CDS:2, partial [Gigaspora rosea]
TLNLAIEAGCTEELYELYQQFIKRIEKQLAEQEGRIMHSENEDDYETIILTESTNIQHTNNLISSNSSESIDISNVGRQVQTIQEQEREHNQDIQESDQGKCTFIY